MPDPQSDSLGDPVSTKGTTIPTVTALATFKYKALLPMLTLPQHSAGVGAVLIPTPGNCSGVIRSSYKRSGAASQAAVSRLGRAYGCRWARMLSVPWGSQRGKAKGPVL